MYADVIDPVIKEMRKTLRLVRKFDRPQKQVASLQTVLRKLMVIKELHNTCFISVAGTQGAGKTMLIKELYGLDDWLVDNAGRGERRPLFILEIDCNEPYACGVTFDGKEEQIDPETLKNELRSFSTEMRYSLLRLYVPIKYFNIGIGFLLLPGYERESLSNYEWQREMRDTLRHSIGSVLVTDQTRMADQVSKKILEDLLKNCFNNRSPIIAITRTEGKTSEDREALRASAAEHCGVNKTQIERVVCTGVGDEWRKQWLPLFLNAIHKYTKASDDVNRQRLADLKMVIDEDLEAAAELLEELVGEAAIKVTSQDLLLDGIMNKFRESSAKYRRNLERKLRDRSESYASLATDTARKQYVQEEEGLKNKFSNFFSRMTLDSSQIEQRFVDRIINNWLSQGERGPLEVTYLALGDMASRKLQLSRVSDGSKLAQNCTKGMPALLGYDDSTGVVGLFDDGLDNTQLKNSLQLLLQKSTADVGSLDRNHAGSREIAETLELLPTLAMEFMRVTQAAVLTAEPGSIPVLREHPIEPEEMMEQISKGFSRMSKSAKEVMGTVMAITAVDVGIDGKLDVPTLLSGGQIAGLGGQLSIVAAGIIALGYASFKVSQAVYQHDMEKKNAIAFLIDGLAARQIEKTLQAYDGVIEELQDRLTQNLSRAYGIDKYLFSERDAMARALYSLKIARRDLEKEVDRAELFYLV